MYKEICMGGYSELLLGMLGKISPRPSPYLVPCHERVMGATEKFDERRRCIEKCQNKNVPLYLAFHISLRDHKKRWAVGAHFKAQHIYTGHTSNSDEKLC